MATLRMFEPAPAAGVATTAGAAVGLAAAGRGGAAAGVAGSVGLGAASAGLGALVGTAGAGALHAARMGIDIVLSPARTNWRRVSTRDIDSPPLPDRWDWLAARAELRGSRVPHRGHARQRARLGWLHLEPAYPPDLGLRTRVGCQVRILVVVHEGPHLDLNSETVRRPRSGGYEIGRAHV